MNKKNKNLIGLIVRPRVLFWKKVDKSFLARTVTFILGCIEYGLRVVISGINLKQKSQIKNSVSPYLGHSAIVSMEIEDNHTNNIFITGFSPAELFKSLSLYMNYESSCNGSFNNEDGIENDFKTLYLMTKVSYGAYISFVNSQKYLMENFNNEYSFLPCIKSPLVKSQHNCASAAITELRNFINQMVNHLWVMGKIQGSFNNNENFNHINKIKKNNKNWLFSPNQKEEIYHLIPFEVALGVIENIMKDCSKNGIANQGQITKFMKNIGITFKDLFFADDFIKIDKIIDKIPPINVESSENINFLRQIFYLIRKEKLEKNHMEISNNLEITINKIGQKYLLIKKENQVKSENSENHSIALTIDDELLKNQQEISNSQAYDSYNNDEFALENNKTCFHMSNFTYYEENI